MRPATAARGLKATAIRNAGDDLKLPPLVELAMKTVVALALVFNVGCGPNSDGSKFREVERIQKTIPIFPGMVETQESRISKGIVASIHKYYDSNAAYEPVKQFYMDELRRSDWTYVGERSVKDWGRDFGAREFRFEKHGYYVEVFYYGERSETGSGYGVTVGWRQ